VTLSQQSPLQCSARAITPAACHWLPPCPRRRRAPRLDESVAQGVRCHGGGGAECAMRRCAVADETDAFNLTTRSMPLPTLPAARRRVTGGAAGPTVHYRSVARLAYVTDDPKPDFNQRIMSCIAVQAGFAKVVATVTLVVRRAYKPSQIATKKSTPFLQMVRRSKAGTCYDQTANQIYIFYLLSLVRSACLFLSFRLAVRR